jgi:hypothetical protein
MRIEGRARLVSSAGAGFPPASAAAIKSGELTLLLQEFRPEPFTVTFVYSLNWHLPAKLRAFLDFTLPRLRSRLGNLR